MINIIQQAREMADILNESVVTVLTNAATRQQLSACQAALKDLVVINERMRAALSPTNEQEE